MFQVMQLRKYLVILILGISLNLLFININKPFWGHHDWNSVVYSNIARNYIRYGYLTTKLGQVTNVDLQNSESFAFITHYPPLLPILISFSFRVFGQTELSARLVTITFSLIMVYFIYRLGKEIHSTFFGIVSATSIIFTPIFLYFGKLPVHDTVVPAVSTFGFWAYVKFIKEKRPKYYFLLILSLVVGGLINWSALYLVVALIFHQLITDGKFKQTRKIIALVPISVFIFALHVFHVRLLGAETSNIFNNVLIRINPFLTADLYGFSVFKYLKQELLLIRQYYTWPIFVGSIIFFFSFLIGFVRKSLTNAQTLISTLFIYGIIQLLVFSQLSFIHDYMIYYLLPFFALCFSYVVVESLSKLKTKVIYPIIVIALITLIFMHGLPFTEALYKTSMHKRAYDIAKIINKETHSRDKTFVSSKSYKEFEEVFVAYYSDREVQYGEELPPNYERNFTLLIRPKDHDTLDQKSKNLLEKLHLRFESDNFIWYKINTEPVLKKTI